MGGKIETVAKTVFALFFVIALSVIVGIVMNKLNSTSSKLSDTLELTDSSGLASYETDKVITGEGVKSAISSIKTIGGDLKLKIKVITLGDSSGKFYGFVTSTSDAKSSTKAVGYSGVSSSEVYYINPSASFTCYQVEGKNNVVLGLVFVQDGTAPASDYDTAFN